MKWTKIAVLLTGLSTIVFSITAYADVNTFRVGHTMIRDQDYKVNGIEMNDRKAGLQQHYSLPVEQVEKGKQEQEACAADI